MTFTDDDLKRLKENQCDNLKCDQVNPSCVEIKALLSRLEAAEDVILDAEDNLGVVNPGLIEVWRELSGKENGPL